MRHNGVPPYRETQTYVVRVLSFAGRNACQAARPGESGTARRQLLSAYTSVNFSLLSL